MATLIESKLTIFVHRASENLTDYESHGEGLICFSLLRGLAERGHQIFAYTNHAAIHVMPDRFEVKSGHHRVPANSLAPWEHSWRADRWLRKLTETTAIDLVWYMNPGGGSPRPPQTLGKPLVVGPLYYGWPEQPSRTPKSGRPRLGIGLQGIVGPVAERGWQRTLEQAALILCATEPHAALLRREHPNAAVEELPVIVEPPGLPAPAARVRPEQGAGQRLSLLFVANLVPNKNPQVFVETIQRLRQSGIDTVGTVLGDGPERPGLEAYCRQVGIESALCFLGKVPNTEVYAALADADFLLSASYGEPYGRGIAEAMSVGTPAICHRSGGPADFIDDGRDGLLANELTAASYTARLQAALSDPNAWNRLSAAAYKKAQEWRSDVVLSRLEAQLQQVAQIDRKRP